VHVLKSGCRWCDCPPEYGPPTTIYNRFVRWTRRGIWENLFRELARNGRSTNTQMIDSTHVKAHRSAAGGKGGRSRLLAGRAEGAIKTTAGYARVARRPDPASREPARTPEPGSDSAGLTPGNVASKARSSGCLPPPRRRLARRQQAATAVRPFLVQRLESHMPLNWNFPAEIGPKTGEAGHCRCARVTQPECELVHK
jgi:hypothetical protein